MMGQIVHGGRGAFSGEINYANDPKKNAKLIAHSDGVFILNNSTIIDSLESHCGLNPRVKNPMTHLILGFSAQDSARLTDERMAEIAKDYLSRMGYDDTPFVVFRHHDKKHPHCHIITSRINNKGKTVKDGNEKWRNVKICKDMTKEYGLYMASGKEKVNEDRLRKMDAVKYHTMHCVQEILAVSDTWQEFSDKLAQIGISFRFRYNKDTNGIEGISYTVDHKYCNVANLDHDVSFTGKKLDKSLTLKEVCKQLGNPKTIAHESAREIYEQRKEDYQFRCTMEEFRHINEKFPDFDTLFAAQGKDAERPFPALEGDYTDRPEDSTSEPNIVTVGLETLGILIMQPYEAHISSGGGGSSSDMKWNDEDKKRRQDQYYKRRKGLSR